MRILVLISEIPNPPTSGARVRNFHLWPAVREMGHQVKVIGLNASPTGWRNRDQAAANNDGEFFRPRRPLLPVRAFKSLVRSHYERARTPRLAERVDELAHQWKPEVIHAEELRMGYYLPRFRGRKCDALQTIALHNVESHLYRELGSLQVGLLRRLQHQLHSRSLETYEAKVIGSADLVFAYSPVDLCHYKRDYPAGNWRLTRNGTDARHMAALPAADGSKLLAVGALSYYPNVSGLLWLLDEVWPRLHRSCSLTVAGSDADAEVRERMARDGIRFVDTPRDLEPLYRESAISVVPLFQGGGTRTKILEACAYQRLVITTTRGLEGLDLAPGREGVVVADDPTEFARAIEYWSQATQERERVAAEGRAAVLKRYEWSIAARELIQHFERRQQSFNLIPANGCPLPI